MALARQTANGELGQLSIGYDAPAEFRVFPHIVPAFREKWPHVHLRFNSLKNSQQLDGLRRDELDLGFIFLPVPLTDEFDVNVLAEVPLLVALPARHPLASASRVAIKQLSHEPLVLFPRALDPETYNQIEQLFLAAGAAMNVVLETGTFLSGVNFVSLGIGCSFLGEYARRVKWDGVVYRPLDPQLVKTVAIIKKKRRGELVEAFYQFTIDNVRADDSKASSMAQRRGR